MWIICKSQKRQRVPFFAIFLHLKQPCRTYRGKWKWNNYDSIKHLLHKLPIVISGITQKALRIKVKHEIWPGDRSIQKETYEYIWQIKKRLVTSFRPLLFFSNNFHKRRLGLKIKMKLDFLRILWGFSFILSNFQEFLNCIGYILSYLPKLNSGLE